LNSCEIQASVLEGQIFVTFDVVVNRHESISRRALRSRILLVILCRSTLIVLSGSLLITLGSLLRCLGITLISRSKILRIGRGRGILLLVLITAAIVLGTVFKRCAALGKILFRDNHIGGIAFVAIFVGIGAVSQLTYDSNHHTLFKILSGKLGSVGKSNDIEEISIRFTIPFIGTVHSN